MDSQISARFDDDPSEKFEQIATIPVPLPTDVPPPPDLSNLPAHILHSGTVETLIGQNEDLMARLKVNIRRNSLLEQQLMEQERFTQDLARNNQSLTAQVQILQEKDRIYREKSQAMDSRQESVQETIQFLETKLGFSESRGTSLAAYRRRVQRWIRPLVKNLRQQLSATTDKLKQTETRLATRDAAIGDMRARLNATIEHCQELERTHVKNQAKLVDGYETRIQLLETQLERARAELNSIGSRAIRFDELTKVNAELENKVIQLNRQLRTSVDGLRGEMIQHQNQAGKFRKEAEQLAADAVEKQKVIGRLEEERRAHYMLQEQFQNLQSVWVDSQKRLEAARLQNESLSRLNQELGRLLKEERTQSSASASAAVIAAPLASSTTVKGQRMEKIDTLLAELESGFAMKNATIDNGSKRATLDILDDNN